MEKKKNRGFTLVELIVVLVILAILAAIMVPSMIGFIDRAKEKSLVVKARHLITAIQTEVLETYAIDNFKIGGSNGTFVEGSNYPSIAEIVELSGIDGFGDAGKDWVFENTSYAIYNGFGWGTGHEKVPAKCHFKAVINMEGSVEGLSFCDGESIVVYSKENGFEVKKADSCTAKHNTGQIYCYLFLHNNNYNESKYNYQYPN